MEKTFTIFIKSEKFVWTKVRILWLILFGCFIIIWIKAIWKNSISENLISATMLPMFVVFILLFISSFYKNELKGTLAGTITFSPERIKINSTIYSTSDIRLIKLTTGDYRGKRTSTQVLSPMFSNGTDNSLILIFENSSVLKVNFLQLKESEFRENPTWQIFNSYLESKKMSKQNFDQIMSREYY